MTRVYIDVREPHEFAMGHVDGAINVPPSSLMAGSPELVDVPRDVELVVYCRSGARSNAAMFYLRNMGFTNIINGINKDHVTAHYKK